MNILISFIIVFVSMFAIGLVLAEHISRHEKRIKRIEKHLGIEEEE